MSRTVEVVEFDADWPIGTAVEIDVIRGKKRLTLTAVPREAA